jgi:CMP-N,N'-diacetyllegionaminic acid synthase
MNLLVTICARGGSKGIPGKNLKPVCNKPLIAYSIECAFKFADLLDADVTISTEDDNIKKAAEGYNLKTEYKRPLELATDTIGKIPVLRDIWKYEETRNHKKYDYFLDLDVTSPLRTMDDLLNAFNIIRNDSEALNLYSVSPAHRNPYFNMVEEGEKGYIKLCKILPRNIFSRQQAPKVYDVNASFYFYTRAFYEQNLMSATTERTLVYIVPHICFDLDEAMDFEFLSYLLENNKLNFAI